MNIARRDVIKGIVLSGVAGALPGALAALTANAEEHFRLTSQPGLASQPVSIHILVAGSSLDDPFLDGAVSSARQAGTNPLVVRLKSSLVDDLNQAEELLRSRRPLVALLAPADAILLVELARGNGLRLSVVGQHTVAGPGSTHRHHLSTTTQSEKLDASLLAGLESHNWPALLGGSLTQIASGSSSPGSMGLRAFLSQADRGIQRPETLTSLLIQG